MTNQDRLDKSMKKCKKGCLKKNGTHTLYNKYDHVKNNTKGFSIKKWVRDMNRHVSKDIHAANKYMKQKRLSVTDR